MLVHTWRKNACPVSSGDFSSLYGDNHLHDFRLQMKIKCPHGSPPSQIHPTMSPPVIKQTGLLTIYLFTCTVGQQPYAKICQISVHSDLEITAC